MGSPASDWPDYPTPEGVGSDGTAVPPKDDTQGATSGTPPEQPWAGSDTQPDGTPGAADATVPATDSQEPATPEPDEQVAKYRFDEVTEANRQLQSTQAALIQQVANLTAMLQGREAAPQSPPKPAEQLTEREQKIVAEMDRLLQHSPTWQKLAPFIDKGDVLLGLADQIPAQQEAEKQYWQTAAQQWMSNVLDQSAKALIGPAATAQQLEPERAAVLRKAFAAYVESDASRARRYESGDAALVQDFIGWFRGFGGATVTSAEREAAAAAQRRGNAIKALPTSGPAGQPVTSAPPKVNNLDEDAVHSAGWAAVKAEVSATR